MERILNLDLEDMIASSDHSGLTNYVRLYQIKVLDQWTNKTHDDADDLERFLRLSEQKISRAKHFMIQQGSWDQDAFSLGMVMGVTAVFRELLREEKRDQQIIDMCASQTEKTDRILQTLASRNGGQGMRHGELAEAMDMPYNSLTNTMKRVLQSRAVTATRSGKNTYYTLTKAGRRYCRKKEEVLGINGQYLADWLRKTADMVEVKENSDTAGREKEQAIYAGEVVTLASLDKDSVKEISIQMILDSPKGKAAFYKNLDEKPQTVRPYAFPSFYQSFLMKTYVCPSPIPYVSTSYTNAVRRHIIGGYKL